MSCIKVTTPIVGHESRALQDEFLDIDWAGGFALSLVLGMDAFWGEGAWHAPFARFVIPSPFDPRVICCHLYHLCLRVCITVSIALQ